MQDGIAYAARGVNDDAGDGPHQKPPTESPSADLEPDSTLPDRAANGIGSIVGRGRCYARRQAAQIALRLSLETADAQGALDLAALHIGDIVGRGHLDRAEAADLLRAAAVTNGLTLAVGEDAVQEAIASGLIEGARQAIEAREAEATAANDDDGGPRRRTQATALIELTAGGELYHAPDGTAYADIVIDGHRQTWPIASRGYRSWLRRAFFLETGGAPNAEAMSTAMGVIEARAQFDGIERQVHLRVAPHEGGLYVDVGDAEWQAIEVYGDGWRVVANPPVRFRRPRGMLALPEPQHGGRLDELQEFLPARGDAYVLAVSWLLTALRGEGPYPVLALAGEQGAGKSTAAAILRRLIDPHSAPLRALARDTRDLYIAAHNGAVVALDNLSTIPAEIADSLCRLSTGGGFATRTLHTDTDETLFAGQRPIILTSIDDVATRSDLADRTLLVALEPIPEANRRGERELWSRFDVAAPRILGALLDVVAHGLRMLPTTHLAQLPRMADYALWMAACESALWKPGTHMAAYKANRREGVDLVLDADPVAQALRQHMEGRGDADYTTTAAELLASLSALVAEHVRRDRTWPLSARALTGRLKRLAPALRAIGITIKRPPREGHARRRPIAISSHAPQKMPE